MKVWTQHQQECLQAMGITQWQSKFEEVAPNKVPSVDPLVVTDMLKSIASTEQGVDATEGILELTETTWETLQSDVSACQLCALHQTRQQAILGKGNQQAKLLIIGNAPTNNDDNQNQSFAGDGGVLLTKMLQAINIEPAQVYLTNVVKCHTPNNRYASVDEFNACMGHLQKQIALIKPELLLIFGKTAAQLLLNNHSSLAMLRQQVHLSINQLKTIVTYSPDVVLQDPSKKRDVWEDLKFARQTIKDYGIKL
jgi:DNA polymerase